MLHDIIEEKIRVEDGMIAIPDRPGLGFTITEDVLATACREVLMIEQRDLFGQLAALLPEDASTSPASACRRSAKLAEHFKA